MTADENVQVIREVLGRYDTRYDGSELAAKARAGLIALAEIADELSEASRAVRRLEIALDATIKRAEAVEAVA